MTDPLLTVIMTTYDSGTGIRTPLAVSTLEALRDKLIYPSLRWIIADDGSAGDHVTRLTEVLKDKELYITDAKRRGVGYSKNIALREAFAHSPFVFLLEDDWVLREPLPIAPYIRVLAEHENLGMVRFGFLGGDMTAKHEEYGGITFWKLQRGSGVYIYSGQVSLRHQRFYSSIGLHSENTSPGEEELNMCLRFNATENAPDIVWPAHIPSTINTGLFINIGFDSSVNAVRPGA